jgi:DNA-binding NtrC family response regulator
MNNKEQDTILIVDDDQLFSELLSKNLGKSFNIRIANDVKEARSIIDTGLLHAILLDLRLKGDESNDFEGLELLEEIKKDRPLIPVIVMTSFASIGLSVRAMQLGADDFIEKGKIEISDIVILLNKTISSKRNELRTKALAEEQLLNVSTTLLGESTSLTEVHKRIGIASQDGYCSVLILGETGTGKEVIARSIHERGWRKEGPFKTVTISTLSPGLIESELFGYDKGAFTGAQTSREGYIEQAQSGILFLDEIGDLSLEIQVKLLKFLEEKVFYRVGSTKPRPVDIQLIFATNVDINKLIKDGKFRQDFYFRIRTIEIFAPPLRERKENIPLLADHFLQQLRKQGRTKLAGISNEALNSLAYYDYPGNVRELKAIIEWAALNANQAKHWIIELEDVPFDVKQTTSTSISPDNSGPNLSSPNYNIDYVLAETELRTVEAVLKMTSGKKTKAEEILGYPNRQTMRRRINKIREIYPDLFQRFDLVALLYGESEIDG